MPTASMAKANIIDIVINSKIRAKLKTANAVKMKTTSSLDATENMAAFGHKHFSNAHVQLDTLPHPPPPTLSVCVCVCV